MQTSRGLQAGAEVDAASSVGLMPLHVAARACSTACANLLLEAGCDGRRADAYGRAPLHYAAQTADWALFSTLYARPGCLALHPDKQGACAACVRGRCILHGKQQGRHACDDASAPFALPEGKLEAQAGMNSFSMQRAANCLRKLEPSVPSHR